MEIEMKVPEMGESVTEAVVSALLKEEGAYVQMDEEVIELETEKVNQVLAAPQAGTIHYRVKVDDTVEIGTLIAVIETSAEAPQEEKKREESPTQAKEESAIPEQPKAVEPLERPSSGGSGARFVAAQFIEEVKQGERPAKVAPGKVVEAEKPRTHRGETRRRMPKIRQVIARRLVQVQQETAMLTTFNEVDMSAVMALRAKHKEEFQERFGVKLGFMSFFVKAVVAALQEEPDVNSYIDGNEIVHRDYYDVGIAVGTERGLVVPVVRDCETLSFAEIEQAIAGYAKKARSGELSIADMEGGGFTITNGGVYGSLLSTPILNAPQSGILGMHSIQKRPVVVDNEVVVRPMMYLALSYDHRIVDGKGAVTFLVHIKQNIEDPTRLLLDLWKGG